MANAPATSLGKDAAPPAATTLRAGGRLWHLDAPAPPRERRAILEDPDSPEGARLLKTGRSTTVFLVPGAGVLKRHRPRRLANLLKRSLGTCRAARAFREAAALRALGIRTPRAFAWSERRRFGLAVESHLLTEIVPGALRLDLAAGRFPEARRRLVEDLGRQVGLLHRSGRTLRDLKVSNLLVDEAARLWIVDLDGLRRDGSAHGRLRDLRRLGEDLDHFRPQPRGESLRFLRAYLRALGSGDLRALHRALAGDAGR